MHYFLFAAMGASSRTLEITVISGENLHVTDEAYVVVRAESINCCTTKTVKDSCSTTDSSFLSWNEKFLVDMPVHARSITFEVQSKKSKGAAQPVGVARIAVTDFLGGGVTGEDCLQVLSYRLRDWEGRRNGVIHFSVRVVAAAEECSVSTAEPAKGMVERVKGSGDRLRGVHVGDKKSFLTDGDKKSCGVVACVPFWWNYPHII